MHWKNNHDLSSLDRLDLSSLGVLISGLLGILILLLEHEDSGVSASPIAHYPIFFGVVR